MAGVAIDEGEEDSWFTAGLKSGGGANAVAGPNPEGNKIGGVPKAAVTADLAAE